VENLLSLGRRRRRSNRCRLSNTQASSARWVSSSNFIGG
jgi:hypothetical protein